MKFKMTPMEKKWVLYDVGNSAFTMLVTTIFPIYFNYLVERGIFQMWIHPAYWGYAASFLYVIGSLARTDFGAIADTKDFKKKIFTIFLGIGVTGCIALDLFLHGSGFSWRL